MNGAEIDLAILRLAHFARRGVAKTDRDKMADGLMNRDRDGDDRRLCVECRHCQAGPRCSKSMPVLQVLQRCDQFLIHHDLHGASA